MAVSLKSGFGAAALAIACVAAPTFAHAQIFGDDEARRAILELRQRFDQSVTAQNRLVEENTQLRRSILQLQSDLDGLRGDLAQERGRQDELEHQLGALKDQLARNQQAPTALQGGGGAGTLNTGGYPGQSAGGAAASASPAEKQEYDAALRKFQSGDFRGAQSDFSNFVKNNPGSGMLPEALFWLGNAQYATRDYQQAINNFRSLLTQAPNSQRAPEALLSIASCQTELNDKNGARATLQSLVGKYPQSEAAQAARDRLAQLK